MEDFIVTPMSLSELANVYGVSVKVMRNWLKPHGDTIGVRVGMFYTPKQVSKIFECLGEPPYPSKG